MLARPWLVNRRKNENSGIRVPPAAARCHSRRYQAVVTDAVEAAGQHVDEEPADELVGREHHHLEPIAAFDPVILPLEGDAPVAERDQSAVGDGDAVV